VLRIDHVVLAVRDLEATGKRFFDEHGLASVPGGRHAAWGTANRVIPLGEDYVELLGVVEPEVAERSPFGRFMLSHTAGGDVNHRWLTVSLADTDLEGTAARLGLEVVTGTRTRPDGREIRWRSAGLEDPKRDPWLPFFVAWEVPPGLHPGRTPAEHRVGALGIARVEMAGDQDRLREWVGGADLPIRIVPGEPGVRAVVLATGDDAELVLR
jgi:hypothetical protein